MVISVDGTCNGTYDTVNKLIHSPDLLTNDSLECLWKIVGPIDKNIILTFINFKVEDCDESFLEIMDGNRINGNEIVEQKLCGILSPEDYESRGRSLLLNFTSAASEKNTSEFTIGYDIPGNI